MRQTGALCTSFNNIFSIDNDGMSPLIEHDLKLAKQSLMRPLLRRRQCAKSEGLPMHSFYDGRHKNKIRTVRQYILAVVFVSSHFCSLANSLGS